MVKSITLGYWNIRGVAEPIRYLLHYKGVQFEDKRYTFENKDEWFDKDKNQLGLDLPNLPYYIDEDVKLTQSIAIMRYLAKKYQLDGKTEKEQLQASLVEQHVHDLRAYLRVMALEDKADRKAEFVKIGTEKLKMTEKFLGARKFLVGDDLTYVDFIAYDTFDFYRLYAPEVFNGLPSLKEYMQRFKNLPQLQKYLKSPSYVKWPIFWPLSKFGGGGKAPDHL